MRRAACDEEPMEWFFGEPTDYSSDAKHRPSLNKELERKGKSVCNRCDVREECLEYAMENDERFGIWGGMTARERVRLKNVSSS